MFAETFVLLASAAIVADCDAPVALVAGAFLLGENEDYSYMAG